VKNHNQYGDDICGPSLNLSDRKDYESLINKSRATTPYNNDCVFNASTICRLETGNIRHRKKMLASSASEETHFVVGVFYTHTPDVTAAVYVSYRQLIPLQNSTKKYCTHYLWLGKCRVVILSY
jgi:hypothetical protein